MIEIWAQARQLGYLLRRRQKRIVSNAGFNLDVGSMYGMIIRCFIFPFNCWLSNWSRNVTWEWALNLKLPKISGVLWMSKDKPNILQLPKYCVIRNSLYYLILPRPIFVEALCSASVLHSKKKPLVSLDAIPWLPRDVLL